MNIENISGADMLKILLPLVERLSVDTNALLRSIEIMLDSPKKPTKTNPGQTVEPYVEELEDGSIMLNVDYINSKKNPQQKHDYIFLDSAEDLKVVAESALEYLSKSQ